MALWTCEACQATNGARARACETCGADRHVPAAPTPKDPEAWRCIWTSRGVRCRMPGTIGNTHGFRCSWHYHALSNPGVAEDYDEFERWVLMLTETPYCSVWTHDPVSALWAAVHGERLLPPFAQPCKMPGCEYAPPPEHMLTARGAFRDVRVLLATIGRDVEERA